MTNSSTKNVKILELKDINTEALSTPANVVLSDNLNSIDVLSICTRSDVQHVVQKSNLTADKEILLSASMILKPTQFINYPLSSILGIQDPTQETEKLATALYFEFSHPEQKGEIVELVSELTANYANVRNPRSLCDTVQSVADELIANAIYNAPFVNRENTASGVTRDPSKVKIDPEKKPSFFLGGDGDRVIIGSRDHYGSLNVKRILERIRDCYEKNPASLMNFDDGGAGIGAFLIFDACTSMYIAVDEGRSTTICCAFPLRLTAEKRSQIPKNLHVWF